MIACGAVRIEEFLDLRIATVEAGEPAPDDVDIARVLDPGPEEVARRGAGWFHKPRHVTWRVDAPPTLDAHLARFGRDARRKIRRVLRETPRRFRFEVDRDGRRAAEFAELYRRVVAGRPRGIDRLAASRPGGAWIGFHLFDGGALVAGLLARRFRGHLSAAFGAFSPELRRHELEHFLILQALRAAIELGKPAMSLGRDTNLYGHHLSLRLPAYKLRIGFRPAPDEAGGRELLRIARMDRFERGAFFYSFDEGGGGLRGELFGAGLDPRPFERPDAPPVRVGGGVTSP
jgi:hypothetical protein